MVLLVPFETAALQYGVEQLWGVLMREDAARLPEQFWVCDGGTREIAAQRAVGRADRLAACVRRRFQRLHLHTCGEAVQKPKEFMLG